MLAIRVLEERPVVGGEKFSAVIGPSRGFRRLTAATLGLSLLVAGWSTVRSAAGGVAPGGWALAGALFAISLASAWVSGGAEVLVCQGGVVRYRRAGALGDRGRIVPVGEIGRIGELDPADRHSSGGVRLETSRGSLTVGRRLSGEEARWLAAAIGDHLAAVRSLPAPAPARSPRPQPASLAGALERVRARR